MTRTMSNTKQIQTLWHSSIVWPVFGDKHQNLTTLSCPLVVRVVAWKQALLLAWFNGVLVIHSWSYLLVFHSLWFVFATWPLDSEKCLDFLSGDKWSNSRKALQRATRFIRHLLATLRQRPGELLAEMKKPAREADANEIRKRKTLENKPKFALELFCKSEQNPNHHWHSLPLLIYHPIWMIWRNLRISNALCGECWSEAQKALIANWLSFDVMGLELTGLFGTRSCCRGCCGDDATLLHH